MDIDLDKLEGFFDDKYRELYAARKHEDFFINYCDAHEIEMMHSEWVKECFNEPREDKLCILSPEDSYDAPSWLLVPKDFATKALVLGYLP